jgi:hypothetical protein
MPSFYVVSFCAHRKMGGHQYNPNEHDANNFIRALKGQPVYGSNSVPVGGKSLLLDKKTAHRAPHWYAQMIATVVDRFGPRENTWLVPVPDSSCIAGTATVPRCLAIANHVVALRPDYPLKTAVPLLWGVALPSAHKNNGPRRPEDLLPALALQPSPMKAGEAVVLIDDVKTTAGHFQACARRLAQEGLRTIGAVAAARTLLAPNPQVDVFTMVHEAYEY